MKKVKVIIAVICLGLSFSFYSCAENEKASDTEGIIEEYAGEIIDSLDEETKSLLNEFGLEKISTGSLFKLTFKDIVSAVKQSFSLRFKEILSSFLKVSAVLLLLIIVNSLREKSEANILDDIFSMVTILLISSSVFDIIKLLSSVMKVTEAFLKSLIPIITVLLSFSGSVTFSAIYSASMIGLCNVIAFTAENIIIPFTGIYFGLVISMSFNGISDITSVCSRINSISAACLGIISTAFSLLLSAKGILSKDFDGVFYKSGKYIISSFIPVVGGAVSGILSYVVGSVNIIKSTVGIFALIAALCLYLPLFIQIFFCRAYLSALCFIGEAFGEKKTISVIRAISKSLGLISILSFFILITVIIATGLAVGIRGEIK